MRRAVWIAASVGAIVPLGLFGALQLFTERSKAETLIWVAALVLIPGMTLARVLDFFPRLEYPVWVIGWIVVLNGIIYGGVITLWLHWRSRRKH